MSRPLPGPARLVLLVLMSLGAVAPGHAQRAEFTPDKLVTKVLNERYPHWALAPVSPPASSMCRSAQEAGRALLTGDFNGDGVPDTALQITVEGRPRVVVVLTRLDAPEVIDVDIPPGPLVVHPAGQHFVSPDLLMVSHYPTDTIGSDVCSAGEAWLWTGDGFRRVHVTS